MILQSAPVRRRVCAKPISQRSGLRSAVGSLLAGLVALVTLAPAAAADWKFDPVLELSSAHTDNARLEAGGSDAARRKESAIITSAELSLGLTGVSPQGEFAFAYRPVYETYSGTDTLDASQLDNTSHLVSLSWVTRRSRRRDWRLSASWSLYERARLTADTVESDVVFVPRTETQTYSARADGTFALSRRSSFIVSASGQAV
ncbi:MAG: hypothetical protein JSV80_15350, partial [Acidobacteriota bacterium]